MNEVLEAIYRAALEQVVALLNDPDPLVRLEAALGIIGALDAEPAEQEQVTYDRDDMAELDEFPSEGTTLVPATGEVMEEIEKKLAADQALAEKEAEERIPPAAERAGRSAIGSGQQR